MIRNNYKIYREIVLNMFGNKCMSCGNLKGLGVHHIDNDFKNNQLNNILLLCKKCHGINHGIDYKKDIKRIINKEKLKEIRQRIGSEIKKSNSKSLKCKYPNCDKVIEGYTDNHAKFLMAQHMLKHENDEKKKVKKE